MDGTLGPIRRAELQLHLGGCEACRALAADLQYVRDTAASLDAPEPPSRLWLQIAGRLHQEGRVATPARPAVARRHAVVLAMAAALILAISASFLFLLRDHRGGTPGPATAQSDGNAQGEEAVQTIADEIRLAELHIQNAIGKLEEAARAQEADGEATLDPQTAATLQKSHLVIDQAIAESRAALRTDPQNVPARDSLFEALRRKVGLLQDTVALMNEMRRGNSAGAAQIMDGLNKS